MIPRLRDYQVKGVSEIRERFAAGIKRTLFVLSTGGGKTVLFSYIAAGVASKGKRVCLIAHREELLNQISSALSQFNVPHSVLAGGTRGLPRSQVLVASIQTLVNRLDHFQPPDLLITDEAHHCCGKTSAAKIAFACKDAFQLGVTATPCRLDGRGLGDVYETMVLGPQTAELTNLGFLAPAEVYAPPERPDLSGLRKRGGDYAIGDLAERQDKPKITGNAVQHYTRLAPGKAAVAFCCSVEHAEHVATEFRAAGYRAVSVDGKMDKDDRRRAIMDLASGKVQVITSCEIISEGVDVPRIEVGIMLRPTQSMGLWLQQVGRCLRPYPGKKSALILDHAGNSLMHGLPDEPREWTLEGMAEGGGKEPRAALKTCRKCLAIFRPAPKCPRCGAAVEILARKVEHVEGELQKVAAADREEQRKTAYAEVQQARDRESLEKIAAARGYDRRWVSYVLAARDKRAVKPAIYETSSDEQLLGLEPT